MKAAADGMRSYSRANVVAFRSTKENFGGLSNMAPGFPLRVNGIVIRTSEALYQACRFPHLPDVQRIIIEEKSPMTAKMLSKPYRDQSRPDWQSVRVKIMRWCLRLKLAQNWKTFGELLFASRDAPIVEDSRKDDFWGARPDEDGNLIGRNILGRLLMELRKHLHSPQGNDLRRVPLPDVKDLLLYGEPVSYDELAPSDASYKQMELVPDESSEIQNAESVVKRQPRKRRKPRQLDQAPKPASPQNEEMGLLKFAPAPESPATADKSSEGCQQVGPIKSPEHSLQHVAAKLAWSGEIRLERWLQFYTRILLKLQPCSSGVKLTLHLEASPKGGLSRQEIEETKSALRELGLGDEISSK